MVVEQAFELLDGRGHGFQSLAAAVLRDKEMGVIWERRGRGWAACRLCRRR